MHAKIQKWGNSQGLRVTKHLLAEVNLEVGDEVELVVERDCIVIKPARRVRGRYRLEDLVKRMPADAEPRELDWGSPVGNEAW